VDRSFYSEYNKILLQYKGMYISAKLKKVTVTLLGLSFVVMALWCTIPSSSVDAHHGESSVVCESLVELVSSVNIQTGITLLTLLLAVWVLSSAANSLQPKEQLFLYFYQTPSLYFGTSPREYCYLQKLFSSGIIHSKLHTL